jgi:hypothetical protein
MEADIICRIEQVTLTSFMFKELKAFFHSINVEIYRSLFIDYWMFRSEARLAKVILVIYVGSPGGRNDNFWSVTD